MTLVVFCDYVKVLTTLYLKLKLQVVRPTNLNVSGMVNNEQVYRGIRDCLSKTYKEGGIRGLYRGVGMHLNLLVFGTVNSAAVLYFTTVLLL